MISSIGFISHLTAVLAYTTLMFLLARSSDLSQQRGSLIAASALSALWAITISGGILLDSPPLRLFTLAELLRYTGWIFLLLQLNSFRADGTAVSIRHRRWGFTFFAGLSIIGLLVFALPLASGYLDLSDNLIEDIASTCWLTLSITGLLLLEQLFRNSSESERWSIKFLCFGLGSVFIYDLYMYSEALLFRRLDAQLWQARGFINAFAAPLIAIFIARYTQWRSSLQPSRQVVFHTVTLMATGFYLLAMAAAGYFIKFFGGNWGGVLQIAFLMAAGAVLLALLFSGKIRATSRVFLSKHFFSYKYDYRTEWLNFTQALVETDENIPEGVLRAMAGLVKSPAGLLWATDEGNRLQLLAHWNLQPPGDRISATKLCEWLLETGWIIDVNELKAEPDLYSGLDYPQWLETVSDPWLLVPLIFKSELQGILLLKSSSLQQAINWEDRDLLKTAGRQAASHLAQHQANQQLVMARQFEAFNRLSAYVVHDLKNILAQQSLMISNAEKHKNNPAFVDDMISTVDNSVNRMQGLMDQMRNGIRGGNHQHVILSQMLEEVVRERSKQQPTPYLDTCEQELTVEADKEQLTTVFDHLIQNAQDASHKKGKVEVRLYSENGQAIVEIEDHGIGMDSDFVQSRLFRPFDSTKGLTGMGIGAFESREFIRSLGGEISVESQPGQGSIFRLAVPALGSPGQSS